MVDRVKSEMETCGFFQIIKGFTRTWPHQRDTAVDHCWSNSEDRVINHSNVVRAGSDHNVIAIRVRMKDRVLTRRVIEKRVRKNLDLDQLKRHMSEVDWTDLLESNNIDVINGIMEKEVQEALDEVAPIKIREHTHKKKHLKSGHCPN